MMSEFSNRDLIISDESVSGFLATLETESNLDAAISEKEAAFPSRSTVPSSLDDSLVDDFVELPPVVRTRSGHHLGRRLLLGIIAGIAIVSTLGNIAERLPQKANNVTAPVESATVEVTPSPSTAPAQQTAHYAHQYKALFPYDAEEVAGIAKVLGCSLSCDGEILEFDSVAPPEELLPVLADYLNDALTQLTETPAHIDFKSVSANDDYSEITIIVTAVSLNAVEQKAVDRLFVPAAIYNNLCESSASSVKVYFNNMLGNTVRTMNSQEF